MGEDRNKWDRAWTVDEMRIGANDWSLASDAGMLQHLQEFSQKMVARTHEIQQQVNGLVHQAKLSSIRVNSAFNDFIMLANTQFVENRVYDEDVMQGSKGEEKNEEKEKTKEEREAELIPKITEAVRLGLSVIDTAFEKLDVNQGDSESDDDQAYRAEPLLEPKDPYIHRALPYIIGSQAFMQDDDVGLIDMPSEDEEEPAAESESESEESESETESEGEKVKAPQQRKVLDKFDSETDSDDGDLFGEKKKFSDDEELTETDEEEGEASSGEPEMAPPQSEPPTQNDFASELASKLGLPEQSKPVAKQAEPRPELVSAKKVEKEKRPKKEKGHRVKEGKPEEEGEDDDLFRAPVRDDIFADEDDDSPFGSGGGLFSSSKKVTSLFDDDEEGGLFDDAPEVAKQPVKQAQPVRHEVAQPSPAPSPKVTKSGKKIPAGGVSIFGDEGGDLFSASAPQEKKPAAALFDDEAEEGDLFAAPSTGPQPQAPKSTAKKPAAKVSALFDNESSESGSDEGDLFADRPKAIQVPKAKPSFEETMNKTPQQSKKKLPPGAVSIFGNAPNPLLEAMKSKQRMAETESDEGSDWSEHEQKPVQSKAAVVKTEPKTAPTQPAVKKTIETDSRRDLFAEGSEANKSSPAPSKRSLFDDEDDVFNVEPPKQKPLPVSQTVKAPLGNSGNVRKKTDASGLFGEKQEDSESDDDLFQAVAKSSKQGEKTSRSNTLLFEDEKEEDLFASQTAADSSAKKKPVGGVALFGGADLFPTETESAPKTATDPKRSESPQVKPKPGVKSPPQQKRTISLFDADSEDEDLFSAVPGKSKQEEKPPTTRKQASGLFDDSEDLFSAQSSDAPDVDLFGSSSPLKTHAPPKVAPKQKRDTAQSGPQPESRQDGTTSRSQTIDGVTSGASTTDADDLFAGHGHDPKPQAVKPKKPPAGAVSMFGGLDPSALLQKKAGHEENVEEKRESSGSRPVAKTDDLFNAEETEGDLVASGPPNPDPDSVKRTPKPLPKFGPKFNAKQAGIFSVKPSSGADETATGSANVDRIKSGLVFNPATLLPGATPPVQEPEVVPVSFDEPVSAKTLTSVVKDRAKIQRNRRPPSRRSRASAAVQSAFDDTATSASTNQSPFSISNSSLPDVSTNSPVLNQRQKDLFGNDELFGDNENRTQLDDTSKLPVKPIRETNAQTNRDPLFEDDIFSSSAAPVSKTSQNEESRSKYSVDRGVKADAKTKETADKVSSWLQTSEPVARPSSKSVFEDDEEDIFASSLTSQPKPAKVVSIKSQTPPPRVPAAANEESTRPKERTLKISSVEGSADSEDENLFVDAKSDLEDDLFSGKKSLKEKTPDKTIHGEDEDLFSIPKTKTIPAKKSVVGDDDDIFGTSSLLTKSKPTPKQNTADIFAVTKPFVPSSSTAELKSDDTLVTKQKAEEKRSDVTDDIFGDISTSEKPSRQPTGDDDLFGGSPVVDAKKIEAKKRGKGDPDDIFSDSFGGAAKKTETKKKGRDDPNDIFGEEVKVASTKSKTTDEGDIFAVTSVKQEKAPAVVAKATDGDIFGGTSAPPKAVTKAAPVADDEDIFADIPKATTKSRKKAKKAVVRDEDIFQDDTDIFADIPAAKPKEKKSKKKTASSKPMFTNNDVDDIFATATASKTTVKKSKKSSAAKSAQGAEGGAPDIFDDPLNAFQ